jgi:hypothetical protein
VRSTFYPGYRVLNIAKPVGEHQFGAAKVRHAAQTGRVAAPLDEYQIKPETTKTQSLHTADPEGALSNAPFRFRLGR